MEEYEYRVMIMTNGEKHYRFYYASCQKAAMDKAEASFIKSAGYRQEVLDAVFTGKRMVDGVLR